MDLSKTEEYLPGTNPVEPSQAEPESQSVKTKFDQIWSKKKWIFVGAGAFILVVSVISIAYIFYKPESETLPESLLTSLLPRSEKVTADLVYEDTSGFSFDYPKSIEVSDVTSDEDVYYTVLSLKRGGEEMKVSMLDTEHESIEDWFDKGSDAPESLSLVGAVSLGGVSASQYKNGGKLLTVAVDQGVLYLIESPTLPAGRQEDESYWDNVHDLFVSSFAFASPEPAGGSGGAGGGNVIYEPEEIIE